MIRQQLLVGKRDLKVKPFPLHRACYREIINKQMKNNYRHGDLLLKQIEELPKNLKKIEGGILALGEVTGHSHTIVADRETLQLYEDEQGRKYFMLKKAAPLTHQEHKTITIEKGLYLVENEQEFDPFKDEIRRVQD